MTNDELDVIVVGAGPVGLLAGILAHDAGLRVLVLDQEPRTCTHSRAIGIHPPALRIMERARCGDGAMTVADALVEAGIPVRRGHGFSGPGRRLGTLDFGLLDPPWDFILMLPQWRTEALLQEALVFRGSERLLRGVKVTGVRTCPESSDDARTRRVFVEAVDALGVATTFHARFVLGCDGKRSTVREALGTEFSGGPYPHQYFMGDFEIGSADAALPVSEHDAAIFVAREGLVESFPLEDGVRRWVAQRLPSDEGTFDPATDRAPRQEFPDAHRIRALADLVATRTGVKLDPAACRMISAFGVERFLAARCWADGVVLVGDSAHVVSPIGGQGMNLGWMHAREAVDAVAAVLRGEVPEARAARGFDAQVQRRARQVMRRAEQNMRLGHRPPGGSALLQAFRAGIVLILLHSPLRRLIARRFTMHGL